MCEYQHPLAILSDKSVTKSPRHTPQGGFKCIIHCHCNAATVTLLIRINVTQSCMHDEFLQDMDNVVKFN